MASTALGGVGPPSSNQFAAGTSRGGAGKEIMGRTDHSPAAPTDVPAHAHSDQVPAVPRGRSRGRSRSNHPQRAISRNSNLRNWASVAVAKVASKGYDLEYFPPTYAGNRAVAEMTEDDIQAADPKLKECIVGFYIGKRIPFKVTEAAFKKAWGANLAKVMANGRGLFFFHIPDREFRRKILEGGAFTVSKQHIVFQQWRPTLELQNNTLMSVPVWVKLKNLPIAFWSSQAISKVASYIGKPLYVDLNTEQMEMLAFARVCVEITANQQPCEFVEVVLHGETCVVEVEYEWRPLACAECGIFGHKCNPPPAQQSAKNSRQAGVANPPSPRGGSSSPVPDSQPALHSQQVQTKERTRDNLLYINRPVAIRAPAAVDPIASDKLADLAAIHPQLLSSPAVLVDPIEDGETAPLSVPIIPPSALDPSWKQVKGKKKKGQGSKVAASFSFDPSSEDGHPQVPRKLADSSLASSKSHANSSLLARPKSTTVPVLLPDGSDEISSAHVSVDDEDLLSVGCPSPTSSPLGAPAESIQDKLLLLCPDPPPSLAPLPVPAKKKIAKKR